MLPNVDGRYCNSCTKSVINFTEMTDEQVQHYFIQHYKEDICGRFKNIQLHRIIIDLPKNIFSIQMPVWKKFLVACLIIFGISIFPFETTIAGNTLTESSFYQGKPHELKTETKKKVTKKKKSRNKRTYFNSITIFTVPEFITTEIYGYTVVEEFPPISKSIFGISDTNYNGCNIKTVSKDYIAKNTPLPKNKYPGPTPFVPVEFILPSILILKRKRKTANEE